jgi:hypothetical protein
MEILAVILLIAAMVAFSWLLQEKCGFKYGLRKPIKCDGCGSLNHGSGKQTATILKQGIPFVLCKRCYDAERERVVR